MSEQHAVPFMTIVVPCYNEAESLPTLLRRFSEIIGERSLEVMVVDNGSTDDTAAILERLLPQYPFARQVTVAVNRGYGYGIVTGLRVAESPYIGWTHADLQTDPADVAVAYDCAAAGEALEGGVLQRPRYIKGRRKGRPFWDVFFTVGMSAFETLYLRKALWDINAQPNVFPRVFFQSLTACPDDFSLDLYLYYMAKKRKLTIHRFEVDFLARQYGTSTWNDRTFSARWRFIKRTLSFSRALRRRMRTGTLG